MGNDVRSWKDPFYRERQRAAGKPVDHPAGLIELKDEDLKKVSGMAIGVETTAPECTFYTFGTRRACCPR
jgi:mersacidin/lichenicidin family type 2 lantibiotic